MLHYRHGLKMVCKPKKDNKAKKHDTAHFEIRTHQIEVASHASTRALNRSATRPHMNFPLNSVNNLSVDQTLNL